MKLPCWLVGHKWELYGKTTHLMVCRDVVGRIKSQESVNAIVENCKECGRKRGWTLFPDRRDHTNADWLINTHNFQRIQSPNKMSEE